MKKHSYHLNIGGASILLLLVVFAMTIFAVLSMRASYYELKMSEKTRDSVENYYSADAKTEEALMYVSKVMSEANKQSEALPFEYFISEIKDNTALQFDELAGVLTCIVPVDYNKSIETKLNIPNDFSKNYDILSYKLIVSPQEYESGADEIWDGIIDE